MPLGRPFWDPIGFLTSSSAQGIHAFFRVQGIVHRSETYQLVSETEIFMFLPMAQKPIRKTTGAPVTSTA